MAEVHQSLCSAMCLGNAAQPERLSKDVIICGRCYIITSLLLGIKTEESREKPSEGKDFVNMHLNGLWQLVPDGALSPLSHSPFLMRVEEIR